MELELNRQKSTNYIRVSVFILLLVFTVFLAVVALPRVLVTLTQATAPGKFSVGNSLFIGNSMLAKADGKDMVTATVFVRDTTGFGIPNVDVQIEGLSGVLVSGPTDADGKTSIKGTSSVPGQYTLTALVGGIPLNQKLTVTFR